MKRSRAKSRSQARTVAGIRKGEILSAVERQALLDAELAKSKKWQQPQDKWRDPNNWPIPPSTSDKPRPIIPDAWRDAVAKLAPPVKPKRKSGGGRKPVFTTAEITKLQNRYRRDLKQDPRLRNQEAAAEHMRPFLPETTRHLSLSTIIRWIVRPVLQSK
jgi:hypothetical protein